MAADDPVKPDRLEPRRAAGLPDRPIDTWTHDELETLVTGFRPTPSASVRAANTVIGAADELGRILMGFVLVLAVLVALAVVLTPWLWIAVAVWAGFAVATVVWLVRRRSRTRRSATTVQEIDPPRG